METVKDLLWQADYQANFHPENRWLDSFKYGQDKSGRTYVLIYVRWIGREAMIMWLCSNQILFEIESFEILPEEAEAIEHSYEVRGMSDIPKHMN